MTHVRENTHMLEQNTHMQPIACSRKAIAINGRASIARSAPIGIETATAASIYRYRVYVLQNNNKHMLHTYAHTRTHMWTNCTQCTRALWHQVHPHEPRVRTKCSRTVDGPFCELSAGSAGPWECEPSTHMDATTRRVYCRGVGHSWNSGDFGRTRINTRNAQFDRDVYDGR